MLYLQHYLLLSVIIIGNYYFIIDNYCYYHGKTNFSSNINEVIRPVLIFYYFLR